VNHELMKDFLRESFPNPERKGCPGEDVLQALAEDRIAPNDSALLHVGSCSECYREYLHLRREIEEAGLEQLHGTPPSDAGADSKVLPFPDLSKRGTFGDP
jgi:hypothetical protein